MNANVTTFTDLVASLRNELMARYKSPFWGVALIAIFLCHWKILILFLVGRPSTSEAIAFVEEHVSTASILTAMLFATLYVVIFPWLELALSMASSRGTRARNDFQIREREREIGRRKVIAQQQAQLIELELKNRDDQSKVSDMQLAREYQTILSGDYFPRWLKDVKNGALNSSLGNTIVNYLNKVDSVEGKFINPDIEKAHERFVEAVSTLSSALNDGRLASDTGKQDQLAKFADSAHRAHQEYRREVRNVLGI